MAWRVPRIFWEYLLLQVPDLALAGTILWLLQWWGKLSPTWAVGLFCLWLAKDLAMFVCMRDVFAPPQTGPEALVGTRGVAKERLAPTGPVLLGGERWRAETLLPGQVVAPGAPVVVRATRGLTLLVEVEASSPAEDGRRERDAG